MEILHRATVFLLWLLVATLLIFLLARLLNAHTASLVSTEVSDSVALVKLEYIKMIERLQG